MIEQEKSFTSSITYPYPKGEHMGAVGTQICEWFLFKKEKNTLQHLKLGNWNSGFVKLGVWWAERDST